MNIIKLFGAIGAAALTAGGLVVAGRTGFGKSEEPEETGGEKAPEEGSEPATEAEAVQTEPESDDGSANA